MPGRGVLDAMDTQPTPQHTFLKAHRAFPRRQVQINNPPLTTASPSRLWHHESQHEALPKSAQIESWIPEPDVVHLTLEHSLPLTPPSNSPEDEGMSWIEGPLSDDNKVTTRSVSSGITTPLIQRSPPTPETTPPRANHLQPTPDSPQARPNQSIGTRTESFETAREIMSSDTESSQPRSTSMQPARQKWLKQTAHARLRDIVLGLGLESGSDDSSLREMTPKFAPKKQDFVTFDGSWGAPEDPLAATGEGEGADKSTSKRHSGPTTVSAQASEKNSVVVKGSLSKSLSLRRRSETRRSNAASTSTEKLTEDLNWPLQDEEQFDLDAKVREVDNRRISQLSTTSTIEAIVIDSPPPKRRQTLRRTGKFSNLDSPDINSNRSSMLSNHGPLQPRKLRHTGSPDQIKRGSVSSDIVLGATSGPLRKRRDSIPQASRPTTAPQGATGYFDGPRQDRRTVSAKLPSPTTVKPQEKPAQEPVTHTHPVAPTVSANTTRKVSRATSTSSVSGIIFNGLQEHPTPVQPVVQSDETQDPSTQNFQAVNFDRSAPAEWAAFRPRSTQVTPFSLRSAHSSTPGTLEVNEATAVNIYPHTNRSILVVQQLSNRDSESVERSAVVASNASFAIPGPNAPAVLHQARARNLLESPLKNPREPPQPPDFKVIPPTPVPNFSPPTNSLDRNLANHDSSHTRSASHRFSGPMTTIKRALSARRYSDAIISPLTRGLHRANSAATARHHRSSYASDRDTKLHPFWRPRGFWDDLSDSDSDSEFGNDGPLVGNSLGMPAAPHTVTRISARNNRRHQTPRRSQSLTQRVSNSLRFPTSSLSRAGAGSSIVPRRRNTISTISRRHGNHLFYNTHPHGPNGEEEANRSYEFIQPEQQHGLAATHHAHVMPRLGYQVQFVGFKGLAQRMEKRKEKRRERLREKLRTSIGPVLGPVQGSAAPQGWAGAGYLRGV